MGVCAIHDKMLKLDPQQRHDYSAAKIVTISGSDCMRAANVFYMIGELAVFPINLGASLGILIYMIGVSALPGVGLILLGVVLSSIAAYYVSKVRSISMKHMDKRVSLTRETLKNFTVVKFYVWEKPFAKMIAAARNMETRYIRIIEALDALNTAFVIAIPSLAGALSFAVKIIIDSELGPSRAFPALTLFQSFIQAMSEVSFALISIADASVALKRLNGFFRLPEVPRYIEKLPLCDESCSTLFKIQNASFMWSSKEESEGKSVEKSGSSESESVSGRGNAEVGGSNLVLENISLNIMRGTMNLVIGNVGSGKTSLLSTFLNAIPKVSGQVICDESTDVTGVLSQWSTSSTVKNNILFGLPYNENRYTEVLRICDLGPDLETFRKGDLTDIGENGVILSGGQRARLVLARCLYSFSELIVLDDILSAMDYKVGSFIFLELLNLTNAGERTIVFSTNNTKWISSADSVIYLKEDKSIEQVFQTTDSKSRNTSNISAANQETNCRIHSKIKKGNQTIPEKTFKDSRETSQPQPSIRDNLDENTVYNSRVKNSESDLEKYGESDSVNEQQIAAEDRAIGSVSNKVIIKYFGVNRVQGVVLFLIMFLFLILYATSESMSNVILNWWTGMRYPKSQGFYIGMYSMDVSLTAVLYAVFGVMFSISATASSTTLHNNAIEGLYATTMAYFHQNPLGRLLTRFTEDLTKLDTMLLNFSRQTIITFFLMNASMIVVFVYIPWTVLCLLPIFVIAGSTLAFYLPATRELNRCNQLFQSKYMQVLSEQVEGQEVIMIYGQGQNSQLNLNRALDDSVSSGTYDTSINFWAASRCGLLCETINIITLFLAVYNVFNLSPSEVGLMISILPSIRVNLTALLPLFALFL